MPETCGHEEELKILRDIARLSGEWGVAFAELQIDPSKARRERAASVGREMGAALKRYKQFLDERSTRGSDQG